MGLFHKHSYESVQPDGYQYCKACGKAKLAPPKPNCKHERVYYYKTVKNREVSAYRKDAERCVCANLDCACEIDRYIWCDHFWNIIMMPQIWHSYLNRFVYYKQCTKCGHVSYT